MKVLHVVGSADPSDGGPIEGVLQTSRWSSLDGNQIELLTLDASSDPLLQSCPFAVHGVGPVRSTYGYTPRLGRWLRENLGRYDAVVLNGIWQYLSYAVWKAARKTNTSYVVFPHGMLDPYFKEAFPWKHRKKAIYWALFERRVLEDADAVIFTCEQERVMARKTFQPFNVRERVVRYGTSAPDIDLAGARETFLDAYPLLKGKQIALFLSRIHPKKGCDLLLQAFSATLASDPTWHLVMAGPDQSGWQPELEKLARSLGIEDRILWTGMIVGAMKWGAFAATEIFVLPSHQENFGIAVVEALACSVPVLISTQVNIWTEIKDCGAGLSAEDNLEGTCAMFKQWTEMGATEKDAMRAAARPCFDKHFEARATAASLDALLEACIRHKREKSSNSI